MSAVHDWTPLVVSYDSCVPPSSHLRCRSASLSYDGLSPSGIWRMPRGAPGPRGPEDPFHSDGTDSSCELARPSVRILCTVVPFMLFYSPSREASSAELTLGILGGRRFHFPMSVIQCPYTRPRAVAPWHALCCQDEAAGDRPVRGTVTNESEPMRVHVFNALEGFEQRVGGGCLCPQGTARIC